jgi:hypothetical protein
VKLTPKKADKVVKGINIDPADIEYLDEVSDYVGMSRRAALVGMIHQYFGLEILPRRDAPEWLRSARSDEPLG